MAEPKRPMDGPKERVLEGCPPQAISPELRQKAIELKGVKLWDCFSNKLTASTR
jgi:hypothetical protein